MIMESATASSPYYLLVKAAVSIPITHYILGVLFVYFVFMYRLLEMHFFQDLFTGFRGQRIILTFNPSSQLYRDVVSKCKVIHGRYLSTPWLCSPHLQTGFIHFFGKSPVVNYRRQLLRTPDGGTLALDWVVSGEVNGESFLVNDPIGQDHKDPIMIVVPGLTTASDAPYIKHLASRMAKRGWHIIVSNHRGLGGAPITSDRFYDGARTDDVRNVVNHIHSEFPEAPLFLVGASLGANIMVKYLGEDGINVPVVGAASICNPWDLLLCDRFIRRKFPQKLYNKALAIGLKKYANKHAPIYSRLSKWEGVQKAQSVREFDHNGTCIHGNFETVDTYYRRCTSSNYVGNVRVPLLCISSLDDPVCPNEAIAWDECRFNDNVILATTHHGGHLPFFEGITANGVWWVRAMEEYFAVLQSSSLCVRHKQRPFSRVHTLLSSIDQATFVHVSEDVKVAAAS